MFERESQQEALQEFDALARIKELVDWEAFRPRLEQVFGTGGASRRRGRPSWDALVMFRALLLGVMHGLSDHQLQYMLLDRRSFKQFAGLVSEDQRTGSKDLVEVSGLAVEVRWPGGVVFEVQGSVAGARLSVKQRPDCRLVDCVDTGAAQLSRGQCDDQGWWGA